MAFIEDILALGITSYKKDCFSRLLSLIFFFIVNITLIVLFHDLKNFIFIFLIGLVIAPIIGYILGTKLYKIIFKKNKKIQFEKSRLYKKLEKSGYLSEFMNTIDEEIKLENTVKYSDHFLGNGLLVTKNWFVYIDILRPIVVKTEDILKISEELSTKSTHFLSLQLKNNTYLRIDNLCYEDIELEIKNKFPNIIIGIGIMDEQ